MAAQVSNPASPDNAWPNPQKFDRAQRIVLALGLVVLYGPTIFDLARTLWKSDEQFHGAIVFIVSLGLFWANRGVLNAQGSRRSRGTGVALFLCGLLFYAVGRSQDILLFEVGSAILVLSGLCIIVLGRGALRTLAFPILFLAFMVPLPGIVVDVLTAPLKSWISEIVVEMLYGLKYPIGRSGVVLSIGPYQLLIADACSGLNSMFSLGALGVLYIYVAGHTKRARILTLVALILPIAFVSNIIRVLILVLITYYFGDEVGQGFVHGLSGMVLFVSALCLLLLSDSTIDLLLKRQRKPVVLRHQHGG